LVHYSSSSSFITVSCVSSNFYYSHLFIFINNDLFCMANNKRLYQFNSSILFFLSCLNHYFHSFIHIN
jgi:hypothetical protein